MEKGSVVGCTPGTRYGPVDPTAAAPSGLPCGARLSRGLAQTRLRLKQSRALIRERLRSSAPQRGRPTRTACRAWECSGVACTSDLRPRTSGASPRAYPRRRAVCPGPAVEAPPSSAAAGGSGPRVSEPKASLRGPRLTRAAQGSREAAGDVGRHRAYRMPAHAHAVKALHSHVHRTQHRISTLRSHRFAASLSALACQYM
ncbi:hypothetical protein H6CHR_01518 [Variovorax sp. PBL-H6]|nr:hypothetical protein H6CHR_01518 [Variovorax sp. PBL-H6]